MNPRPRPSVKSPETDLAAVQGGMTQEELVDFIERFRQYAEENQRRMIDDVLW